MSLFTKFWGLFGVFLGLIMVVVGFLEEAILLIRLILGSIGLVVMILGVQFYKQEEKF